MEHSPLSQMSTNGTDPHDAIDWRASQLTDLQATLAAGHSEASVDRFVELLLERLVDEGTLAVAFEPAYLEYARTVRQLAPHLYHRITMQLRTVKGLYVPDWEKMVETLPGPGGKDAGHLTLTQILAMDIPAPISLIDGLMHEGMLLFAGKSKRGKSWLMFDLALSIATGSYALRHFPCPEPRPVLYIALEDGVRRIQGRARAIQHTLAVADNMHLRFTFDPILSGGIARLGELIEEYHYGLVVIDILAKLEAVGKGAGEKSYHEVYDMFGPLQELRQQHPFCLAMLTHLRKGEAEDTFEGMHGSVAYQGAQDVLWVLERKPQDNDAFLHIRDKDAEDTTLAITFNEGHWEYLGEGERYQLDKERRAIVDALAEAQDELSIGEIMKMAGIPEGRYGRTRKLLGSLVKDDMIHPTTRGKYSATIRAMKAHTFSKQAQNDDDVPF